MPAQSNSDRDRSTAGLRAPAAWPYTVDRRRMSVRSVTRVRGENARSQIRGRFADTPENRRQVHPSQTVPAEAHDCENDSAANRASRQARNGLFQDHSRITQGSRRGWGGDGTADAGVRKGTDMRRKTTLHALSTPAASPLISPTRKRADDSHGRERATYIR